MHHQHCSARRSPTTVRHIIKRPLWTDLSKQVCAARQALGVPQGKLAAQAVEVSHCADHGVGLLREGHPPGGLHSHKGAALEAGGRLISHLHRDSRSLDHLTSQLT